MPDVAMFFLEVLANDEVDSKRLRPVSEDVGGPIAPAFDTGAVRICARPSQPNFCASARFASSTAAVAIPTNSSIRTIAGSGGSIEMSSAWRRGIQGVPAAGRHRVIRNKSAVSASQIYARTIFITGVGITVVSYMPSHRCSNVMGRAQPSSHLLSQSACVPSLVALYDRSSPAWAVRGLDLQRQQYVVTRRSRAPVDRDSGSAAQGERGGY